MAESVFATLECELSDAQPGGWFATHQQAKLAIFGFLEAFYIPHRRRSALAMRSPAAFEPRPLPRRFSPTGELQHVDPVA